MFIPNGHSRQRRNINLGGLSYNVKSQATADDLLRRTQEERSRRERERRVAAAVETVQTVLRRHGESSRATRGAIRRNFDRHISEISAKLGPLDPRVTVTPQVDFMSLAANVAYLTISAATLLTDIHDTSKLESFASPFPRISEEKLAASPDFAHDIARITKYVELLGSTLTVAGQNQKEVKSTVLESLFLDTKAEDYYEGLNVSFKRVVECLINITIVSPAFAHLETDFEIIRKATHEPASHKELNPNRIEQLISLQKAQVIVINSVLGSINTGGTAANPIVKQCIKDNVTTIYLGARRIISHIPSTDADTKGYGYSEYYAHVKSRIDNTSFQLDVFNLLCNLLKATEDSNGYVLLIEYILSIPLVYKKIFPSIEIASKELGIQKVLNAFKSDTDNSYIENKLKEGQVLPTTELIIKELGLISKEQLDPAFYILCNILKLSSSELDAIQTIDIINLTQEQAGQASGGSIKNLRELNSKKRFINDYMTAVRVLVGSLKPWYLEAIRDLENEKTGKVYKDQTTVTFVDKDNDDKMETESDNDSEEFESDYIFSSDDEKEDNESDFIKIRTAALQSKDPIFLPTFIEHKPKTPKARLRDSNIPYSKKMEIFQLAKERYLKRYGPNGVKIHLDKQHIQCLGTLFDIDHLKKLAIGVYSIRPKGSLTGPEDGVAAMSFFIWLVYTVAPSRRNEIITSVMAIGGNNNQLFEGIFNTLKSLIPELPTGKGFKLKETTLDNVNNLVQYGIVSKNAKIVLSQPQVTPFGFGFTSISQEPESNKARDAQVQNLEYCKRAEQVWVLTLFISILLDKFLLTLGDDEFYTGSPLPLTDISELITYLKNVAFCMYSSSVGSAASNRERIKSRRAIRKTNRKSLKRKLQESQPNKSIFDSQASTSTIQENIILPQLLFDSDSRSIITKALNQLYSRDSRRPFCVDKDHWTVISQVNVKDYIQVYFEFTDDELDSNGNPIFHYIYSDEDDEDVDGENLDDDMDLEDDYSRAHRINQRRRLTTNSSTNNPVSPSAMQPGMRNMPPSVSNLLQNSGASLQSMFPGGFGGFGGMGGLSMGDGGDDEQANAMANIMSMLAMGGSPFGRPRQAPQQDNHLPIITAKTLKEHRIKREILSQIPFVIPFEERARIFRGIIEHDREQLNINPHMNGNQVTIHRDNVFADGYSQLNPLKEHLKERVQITFIDKFGTTEAGVDGGGVFKEFLTTLCKEAINTNHGLFAETEDNLLYPSPHAFDLEEQLNSLEFLGRIIGKAMYEGILIDNGFASFFLAKWLGRQSYLDDLPSLDKEVYKGLVYLKNTKEDVSEMSLTFSVDEEEFGVNRTVELVPDGSKIQVTNENKIRYIYLMSNYKLNAQISKQCSKFFSGLRDLINPGWLKMFNQAELQTLVGGTSQSIDIEDLQENTVYAGEFNKTHETIKWFWEILEKDFTQENLSQLIKFSTGCSRPPLLGFSELAPKFCIQAASDDQQRLPTASTCVNLLKLPVYTSKQTLKQKLLESITSETGFEFS